MAITRSFKLAEFIRHMSYNSSTDRIETGKEIQDENTTTGGTYFVIILEKKR